MNTKKKRPPRPAGYFAKYNKKKRPPGFWGKYKIQRPPESDVGLNHDMTPEGRAWQKTWMFSMRFLEALKQTCPPHDDANEAPL